MSTQPSHPSNLNRGYLIALASAVVLSTTAIFIRYLTQTYHLPALVLAFWRDIFVTLTLLIVLGIWKPHLLKVSPHHLSYLIIYGFVLALFNSTWTLSVALNGAAVSTVMAYCSAGFTALLGWWFLKEYLDWGKILAVALSLAGCLLVSGALDQAIWNANVLGIVMGVLSGLCYAVYSLMGRTAAQRGLNPWTTLLYTFGFAAIILMVTNLAAGGSLPGSASAPADFFWLGNALAGWGILFLLAAGPTLIGFGLYNTSLNYLPASIANLIATLEPVFTTVSAYLLFGERLNGIQLIGGLMILGGVVFLRIHENHLASRRPVTG
jgi:drug/metabolite transporter (DMT)-like permease